MPQMHAWRRDQVFLLRRGRCCRFRNRRLGLRLIAEIRLFRGTMWCVDAKLGRGLRFAIWSLGRQGFGRLCRHGLHRARHGTERFDQRSLRPALQKLTGVFSGRLEVGRSCCRLKFRCDTQFRAAGGTANSPIVEGDFGGDFRLTIRTPHASGPVLENKVGGWETIAAKQPPRTSRRNFIPPSEMATVLTAANRSVD